MSTSPSAPPVEVGAVLDVDAAGFGAGVSGAVGSGTPGRRSPPGAPGTASGGCPGTPFDGAAVPSKPTVAVAVVVEVAAAAGMPVDGCCGVSRPPVGRPGNDSMRPNSRSGPASRTVVKTSTMSPTDAAATTIQAALRQLLGGTVGSGTCRESPGPASGRPRSSRPSDRIDPSAMPYPPPGTPPPAARPAGRR